MNPRRLIFVSLFLAAFCFAQDRGTITGIVSDASGSTVPDATVTAKNTATGLTQTSKSGSDGTYNLPYLPVGTYTVTVEKVGFRTTQAAGVRASVNSTARIDMQLDVGDVLQTIEVAASAPLLQTERTDLGQVFNSKTILDLPLSLSGGPRNNLQFVLLMPGVTGDPGDSMSLRIGGGLASAHSMLLDGTESNSERRNDPAFQAVSTDAIEEFKVQTNAFSAEYGRTGNGVINFTTKSGTNQLRGSVFEFFRNDKLNARGFYPQTRPVLRQNIFGGTVGGPVFIPKVLDGRNKAFFFLSYEKSIFRAGNPSSLTSVPPPALRRGDFSDWKDGRGRLIPIYDPATTRVEGAGVVRDQFPGNVIPPNRIHPVANKLNSFLPAPERPGLFNNILAVGNSGSDQPVFSIKGDYIFSAKGRASGLFSRVAFGGPEPIGPIPGPLGENFSAYGIKRYYRLNHDQIFSPTLLNHFTFGWNKQEITEFSPKRLSPADQEFVHLKGVPGSANALSKYWIGDGYPPYLSWVDTFSPSRTLSINDQVAWIKGPHSLKFGFNLMRQYYRRNDCNTCNGDVTFDPVVTGLPGAPGPTGSAYAAFLLGLPFTGTYSFGGDFTFETPYYAWYLQDDYKVSSRLTLNLGLRYEIPIPQAEKYRRQSNLCLHCSNPAAGGILGALIFAGDGPGRSGMKRFTETRYNAWGPRLGIAYQLRSKTVLRAGGAVYYIPMRVGANADRRVQGFGGLVTITSPTGFSEAFTLDAGFPPTRKPPFIDPGLNVFGAVPYQPRYAERAPYFYDWNFTLEQGLGNNTLVRASYQATLGQKLLANLEDINQVDPKYLALGQLLFAPVGSQAARDAGIPLPWPAFPTNRPVNQALRPLPQYTGIDRRVDADTTGHSTYHALTLSAEHRYANGLWFLTSYTFSKLISNVQTDHAGGSGFVGNGDVGTQNAYDRRADKSISNEDVPHHLVVSYSYELPIGKGKKLLSNSTAVANNVLGGWKITAVHYYQAGYPLRVLSNQNIGLLGGGTVVSNFGTINPIRANVNAGVPLKNPAFTGDPSSAPYINPTAFSRPPNFTFGNSGRNLPKLRSPAQLKEDIALGKNFFLSREGRELEFRASMFNVLNRTQFGGINMSVESPIFGRITSQRNSAREVQFSLRLKF